MFSKVNGALILCFIFLSTLFATEKNSPKEIKTIIFDLGNVLVYFDNPRMCAQIAALSKTTADQVHEKIFLSGLLEQFERGNITSHQFYLEMSTIFLEPVNEEEFFEAFGNIYTPNTQLIKMLPELKKNYRLVLLSNTSEAHFEFIRDHFNFMHCFDALTLSYQVGAKKPEDKIFQTAVSLAQCSADQCIYIDDIALYVEQARLKDIDAILYLDNDSLLQQLKLRGVVDEKFHENSL